MDKQMNDFSEYLKCRVCGGQAHGYNFDQISCESCKAFFRRNAYRDLVRELSIDVDD